MSVVDPRGLRPRVVGAAAAAALISALVAVPSAAQADAAGLDSCVDGLNVRSSPSVDGQVVGVLSEDEEVTYLGEHSAHTTEVTITRTSRSGPARNISQTIDDVWLRVRLESGVEGWVHSGGMAPPAVQASGRRVFEVVGWSGDGKLAYLDRHLLNLACDYGSRPRLEIMDIARNRIVASLDATDDCGGGDVWFDDRPAVKALLREHDIQPWYRSPWSPPVGPRSSGAEGETTQATATALPGNVVVQDMEAAVHLVLTACLASPDGAYHVTILGVEGTTQDDDPKATRGRFLLGTVGGSPCSGWR